MRNAAHWEGCWPALQNHAWHGHVEGNEADASSPLSAGSNVLTAGELNSEPGQHYNRATASVRRSAPQEHSLSPEPDQTQCLDSVLFSCLCLVQPAKAVPVILRTKNGYQHH